MSFMDLNEVYFSNYFAVRLRIKITIDDVLVTSAIFMVYSFIFLFVYLLIELNICIIVQEKVKESHITLTTHYC